MWRVFLGTCLRLKREQIFFICQAAKNKLESAGCVNNCQQAHHQLKDDYIVPCCVTTCFCLWAGLQDERTTILQDQVIELKVFMHRQEHDNWEQLDLLRGPCDPIQGCRTSKHEDLELFQRRSAIIGQTYFLMCEISLRCRQSIPWKSKLDVRENIHL